MKTARLGSGLLAASAIGLWIRLGIVQGTRSLIAAQTLGCFIMGLLYGFIDSRPEIDERSHFFVPNRPVLFAMLTSGLCGSITTFSSWNAAILQQLLGGTWLSVWGAISEFYQTLGVSYAALLLGLYCFRWWVRPWLWLKVQRPSARRIGSGAAYEEGPDEIELEALEAPEEPDAVFQRHQLFPLILQDSAMVLTVLAYVLIIVLGSVGVSTWTSVSAGETGWPLYFISTVFAPWGMNIVRFDQEFQLNCTLIGTLLRFTLSTVLLIKITSIKVAGTFVANVGGTLIFGLLEYFLRAYRLEPMAELILRGLQQGFCGCLTTLSSFVVELAFVLPAKHGAIYLISSVLLSQLLLVATMGVGQWRSI